MKKITSLLLILLNINIPVHAGTWIMHEGYNLAETNGIYKGAWEYKLDNGAKAIGWQYINNNWYYFDPMDGCALKGLNKIDNNWYYFFENNVMAKNEYVDIYNNNILFFADDNGVIHADNFILKNRLIY